jgi:hypothetical protein
VGAVEGSAVTLPRFGGPQDSWVKVAGGGSTTQRRGETPSQAMHRLEDEVADAQHCPDCGQRVDPQDPEAVDPGDSGGHWWHRCCMRAAEDFAERF